MTRWLRWWSSWSGRSPRPAGYTAADGAVAQVEVTGLIATAFDHYDSRSGDPQLHTHVVISNKVSDRVGWTMAVCWTGAPCTAAVVALSEHYNAVLADRLGRARLGVEWEARDRGGTVTRAAGDHRGQRGADRGVLFSTPAISMPRPTGSSPSTRLSMAAGPRRRSDRVRLRAQATLATRPEKQVHSLADLTSGWRDRAGRLLGEDATGWAGNVLAEAQQVRPLRADDVPLEVISELGQAVVEVVGEKRSSLAAMEPALSEASRQIDGMAIRDRERTGRRSWG